MPLDIRVLPEDGEASFLEVIAEARRNLRVMVYQLGPSRVLDALAKKVSAGVPVKAILDGSRLSHNGDNRARLEAAGIEVRWGNPRFTFTHAKMIVADEAAAVISTGNFVARQVQEDRNFAAIDRDPDDVAALAVLFDADWDRTSIDVRCARIVVAPDNARERILGLIGSARRTLDVESMEMADEEIRDVIADRRRAGARVRVVLADPHWVTANHAAARILAANGVRARYLVSPSAHAKAIVVDGRVAYIGSVNMSYTSLSRNREIGVLIDEPDGVAKVADTLARDWSAGVPFASSGR